MTGLWRHKKNLKIVTLRDGVVRLTFPANYLNCDKIAHFKLKGDPWVDVLLASTFSNVFWISIGSEFEPSRSCVKNTLDQETCQRPS